MHSKRIMITRPQQNEQELFYSGSKAEAACIGHLRIDFSKGNEFWSTWWPHKGEVEGRLNDAEFKGTIDHVVNAFRKHLLQSRSNMQSYLKKLPTEQLDEWQGFKAECNGYDFYIRCKPQAGDYDCYCYCYDRNLLEQAMAQGEDMSEEENIGMEMN